MRFDSLSFTRVTHKGHRWSLARYADAKEGCRYAAYKLAEKQVSGHEVPRRRPATCFVKLKLHYHDPADGGGRRAVSERNRTEY